LCARLVKRMAGEHSAERERVMSAKDLAKAVAQRFAGMGKRERIAKIRKLAAASPADAKFVRESFPELYREAFVTSSRGAGGHSAAGRRRAPGAATR
jgi:hypothetical protein